MEVRVGLVLVLVLALGAGWASASRQLAGSEISGSYSEIIFISAVDEKPQELEMEIQALGVVSKENQVCTLCEEFAAQAIDYLAENKTQTEVIDYLHAACSRASTFKQQCITLVDYYAPLFFLEVSSIQPEDFCKKVNLCQEIATLSSEFKEDSCEICHHALSEVLLKLKDPDTQLEIIEILLKGCNSMENYARKCKKMVFEYGPLVLANAEQFLEKNDICTMLHACNSPKTIMEETSAMPKADS